VTANEEALCETERRGHQLMKSQGKDQGERKRKNQVGRETQRGKETKKNGGGNEKSEVVARGNSDLVYRLGSKMRTGKKKTWGRRRRKQLLGV